MNHLAGFLIEGALCVADGPILKGIKGMVFPQAYIFTGAVLGTTLTDDDVSGEDILPSIDLNTESFTF